MSKVLRISCDFVSSHYFSLVSRLTGTDVEVEKKFIEDAGKLVKGIVGWNGEMAGNEIRTEVGPKEAVCGSVNFIGTKTREFLRGPDREGYSGSECRWDRHGRKSLGENRWNSD
jgi:hypothetical protein